MALNTDEETWRKSAKSSNLKTCYKSSRNFNTRIKKKNWVRSKYSWLPTTRLIAITYVLIRGDHSVQNYVIIEL